MSIKIGTKKVIVKGEQVREIVELSCLKIASLPTRYLLTNGRNDSNHLPSVWLWEDRIMTSSPTVVNLTIGNTYPEKTFQETLTFIKAAGDRLHDINKELAEANKNWNGDETFVI